MPNEFTHTHTHTQTVLAEDAIKAALKDYKLKQERMRDASTQEVIAQ